MLEDTLLDDDGNDLEFIERNLNDDDDENKYNFVREKNSSKKKA